jgi:hypothetical protein
MKNEGCRQEQKLKNLKEAVAFHKFVAHCRHSMQYAKDHMHQWWLSIAL